MVLFLAFATQAHAFSFTKVWLCHQKDGTWSGVKVNYTAMDSKIAHGDFLYNGAMTPLGEPLEDVDAWCKANAPQ